MEGDDIPDGAEQDIELLEEDIVEVLDLNENDENSEGKVSRGFHQDTEIHVNKINVHD